MSTILKALKQLEQEEAAPSSGETPAAAEMLAVRRGRRRFPVWLGLGLATAGISLIAVAIAPMGGEEPASALQVAGTPTVAVEPALPASPDAAIDAVRPPAALAVAVRAGRVRSPADEMPPELAAAAVDVPSPADEVAATPVRSPVELAALDTADRVEVPSPVESFDSFGEGDAVAVEVESPMPSPLAGDAPLAVESPVGQPQRDAVLDVPSPVAVFEVVEPARDVIRQASRPAREPAQEQAVLSNDDLAGSASSEVGRARELVQASPRPAPAQELERVRVARAPEPAVERAPAPDRIPVTRRAVAGAKPPSQSAPPRGEAAVDAPLAPLVPAAPLSLQRTRWHPQPELREANVRLEGTDYVVKQGDQLAGREIVEITPSSIVVGQDGQTTRIPVGN